ncbi:hypothetical protein BaRGS_00035299 [Batillaria attramentaria]|uniref:Uncharacterized protein n=1 Tax=Batillaria attramentaria TaxID=370345 RepID=A0ABD0JF90_9CAEN
MQGPPRRRDEAGRSNAGKMDIELSARHMMPMEHFVRKASGGSEEGLGLVAESDTKVLLHAHSRFVETVFN